MEVVSVGTSLPLSLSLSPTGSYAEVCKTTLRLSNPSDKRVLFKVKTTAPKSYCVRPNSGIIAQGATQEVDGEGKRGCVLRVVCWSYTRRRRRQLKYTHPLSPAACREVVMSPVPPSPLPSCLPVMLQSGELSDQDRSKHKFMVQTMFAPSNEETFSDAVVSAVGYTCARG